MTPQRMYRTVGIVTPRNSSRNGLSKIRCMTGMRSDLSAVPGVNMIILDFVLHEKLTDPIEIDLIKIKGAFVCTEVLVLGHEASPMPKLASSWVAIAAASAAAAILARAVVGGLMQEAGTARPSTAPHELTLVYVGADDCAPCRTWQQGAGAAFRSSAEFARVSYREVRPPTLLDALKDEYWPEDLRLYRDRLGRGAGVPLWLVIVDDEVIERGFGASQWHGTVLPKLKSLLR